MAQTLDSQGNVVVNGLSTNLSPSQYAVNLPKTVSTSSLTPPTTNTAITQPSYDVNGYTNSANSSQAYISSSLGDAERQAEQEAQMQKDLFSAQNSDTSRLVNTLNGGGTNLNTSTVNQVYGATGVNEKQAILGRLNAESLGLGYAKDTIPLQLQNQVAGQGVTDRGLAPIQTAQLRNNAIQLASNAYQAAIAKADFDTAKAKADEMIAYKYDTTLAEINAKKTNLENIKMNLTSAEKKLADITTRRLDAEQKQAEQKMADEKYMSDVLLKAKQGGIPNDLASTIQEGIDSGKLTPAKVNMMLGQYTGPIPASAQEYQYAVNNGYKGSFSQYQTEDANRKAVSSIVSDATTVLPQDTTKALGQLSFLKKTVESAEALKEASGQSGLRTKAGDWFVGGTKYRQLENLNNTLKTNILTMMVDPAVKKFFGPQMTNQDVRLMTAGGTTLNVESQTPEQMQVELTRLKDLFQRAEDAVNEGLGQPAGQMSSQGKPQTPAPQFEGYTLGADGKYYKNK